MKKFEKWLLAYSATYLLNFIGFFFFSYDVLESHGSEINTLARTYGGLTGPLFLLILVLFVVFIFNEVRRSHYQRILRKGLVLALPILATLGHGLIIHSALALYQFVY